MKTGRGKEKAPLENRPQTHKAASKDVVFGSSSGNTRQEQGVPPDRRWTWHYWQLTALRQRLMDERNLLNAAAREENPHYSMSMADAATDEWDRDLLLSEVSSEQELLYEIEDALHRMQEGTFGLCQMTGKPIPLARLRAVPWARFDVESQAMAEAEARRNGRTPTAHLGQLGSIRQHVRGNLEESQNEEEKPEIQAKDETLRTINLPPKDA